MGIVYHSTIFSQSRILIYRRYNVKSYSKCFSKQQINQRTQGNIRNLLGLARIHEGFNTVGIPALPHTMDEAWPFPKRLCPRDAKRV